MRIAKITCNSRRLFTALAGLSAAALLACGGNGGDLGGGGGGTEPDAQAPTVAIAQPQAGATLAGTVTVSATASDNVGVVGVQFRLDGQNLVAEDREAPYEVEWNTTESANGSHTLSAVARDQAGNTTTATEVALSVSNPVPIGAIDVSVGVSGPGGDPDGFAVLVDGAAKGRVNSGGTLSLSALPAGSHTVTLDDIAYNCDVTGSTSQSVLVMANQTAAAAFDATCEPALSQRIAFVRSAGVSDSGDIYRMNGDGTHLVQLTNTVSAESGPAWSPDGSKIAFVTRHASDDIFGNEEIYVMNSDGTGVTRLTTNEARDRSPTWSPDGSQILFSTDRNARLNFELYVMDADGANPVRLTEHPGGIKDRDPAWSPDGSRIAFTRCYCSGADFRSDILVMNADGTGSKVVWTSGTGTLNEEPQWSPDGRRIVFVSSGGSAYEDIGVMNVDGSGYQNLTQSQDLHSSPTWAADGRILFTRYHAGGFHLTMMNADGADLRIIGAGTTVRDFEPDLD